MKKGFTLIELLAVIVILAIIALIATPIILGIINDAREESDERSVELYASAIKNGIAAHQLRTGSEVLPGTYNETNKLPFEVEYDGKVDCESIIISEDGKVSLEGCTVNGSDKEYSYGKEVGYTGTIYRNSTEVLSIGNYINTSNRWCAVVPGVANSCILNNYTNMTFNSKTECETALENIANSGVLDETMQDIVANAVCEQGTLTYETSPTNINKSYYLKHDVVDNKVTASYACITYTENGIRKDACVRGADQSYYESNQTVLRSIESYFNTLSFGSGNGSCNFYDSSSYCYSDSLELYVYSSGSASSYGGSMSCDVDSGGNSTCDE